MVGRKAIQRGSALQDQADDAQPRQQEALRYIAEMAGELASLAGAERMPMLTYFLNMARVEAEMGATGAVSASGTARSKSPPRRRASV